MERKGRWKKINAIAVMSYIQLKFTTLIKHERIISSISLVGQKVVSSYVKNKCVESMGLYIFNL